MKRIQQKTTRQKKANKTPRTIRLPEVPLRFKTVADHLGVGLVRAMSQPGVAGVMLLNSLVIQVPAFIGEKYRCQAVGSIGPFTAVSIQVVPPQE